MSATETLMAEIAALLTPISNIGSIYQYPRWGINPNDVESELGFSPATEFPNRTWRVQYTEILAGPLEEQRRTQGDNLQRITIVINHYREIYDPGATANTPSYTAFLTMAETIRDTLRATYETATAQTLDVASREEPDFVEIGGTYRCHRVRMLAIGQAVTSRT